MKKHKRQRIVPLAQSKPIKINSQTNQCSANIQQDQQTLTGQHNDLTAHFTAGPSPNQYGQPLLMTSSGLLLTATVPTAMLTSHHLTNLTPQLQQTQQMPALHQFATASNTNLSNNFNATAQFLANHNGFPYAVATTAPLATVNASTSHFLSKNSVAQTPTTLLANIPLTKTPSTSTATILSQPASTALHHIANVPTSMITQTSTVTTTTATVSATTQTSQSVPVLPIAIINPTTKTITNNGPPPLAPTTMPIVTASQSIQTNQLQTREMLKMSSKMMPSLVPTVAAISIQNSATKIDIVEASVATSNLIATQQQTQIDEAKQETILTASNQNPMKSNSMDVSNGIGCGGQQKLMITKLSTTTIDQQIINDNDVAMKLTNLSTTEMKSKSSIDCLRVTTTIEMENSESQASIECTKSPILSQPKTIRFPATDSRAGLRRSDNRIVGCCYWDACKTMCETSSNLLDHLQTQHVNTQAGPYSCRWANCKVHGRESCSRKWLERHVLSHGGSKFFKCIFEKCRMRFGSQVKDSNLILQFQYNFANLIFATFV